LDTRPAGSEDGGSLLLQNSLTHLLH